MKNKILGKRIIALTIDMMISSIFFIGVLFLLLINGYRSKVIIKILTVPENFQVFIFIIFIFFYFVIQEILFKKTFGKKIMNLKIINYRSDKVKFYQIIIRNIFRITDQLFYIGSIFILFDNKGRRLGDLLSKTVVVNDYQDE